MHKYKYTKTNTGSKDPPGRKPCPCLLFTSRHPPPPLLHSKSSKHAAAAMPFGLCILASAVCKTLTVSVLFLLHAQSISKAPPLPAQHSPSSKHMAAMPSGLNGLCWAIRDSVVDVQFTCAICLPGKSYGIIFHTFGAPCWSDGSHYSVKTCFLYIQVSEMWSVILYVLVPTKSVTPWKARCYWIL